LSYPNSDEIQHLAGGGSAYDASEIPALIFSAFLCTGDPVISQPWRLIGGANPQERHVTSNDFLLKKNVLELLRGVETPIPQKKINAAASDRASPVRIKTVEIIIDDYVTSTKSTIT
jgi:hypothetical protein